MPVPCARCQTPLPTPEPAAADAYVCAACGSRNIVRLFPALSAQAAAPAPELALSGEAACYDHPAKRAVAACQQCGRFVCRLCSVEFGGGIWCPMCIATGKGQAQSATLESSLTLYDSIALILSLAPLPFFFFTILTAPASLALTALKWRAPLSPVRRNRWRFGVAIGVSVVEIGLWILFAFGVAIALRSGLPKP